MDTCPECGADLEGLDIPAHAEWHWPTRALNDALTAAGGEPTEAHKRKAALLRAGKQRATKAAPAAKPEDK